MLLLDRDAEQSYALAAAFPWPDFWGLHDGGSAFLKAKDLHTDPRQQALVGMSGPMHIDVG
jgi:hypothetical protein